MWNLSRDICTDACTKQPRSEIQNSKFRHIAAEHLAPANVTSPSRGAVSNLIPRIKQNAMGILRQGPVNPHPPHWLPGCLLLLFHWSTGSFVGHNEASTTASSR